MIKQSSALSHGYQAPAGGQALVYTIPMKSNAAGDEAKIRSFQFRALAQDASNRILSSGGSHALGVNSVSMIAKRRPPLMHQKGVLFTVENNGVKICEPIGLSESPPIGTVSFFIKPTLGVVRITRGSNTIDLAVSGDTVFLNNPTVEEQVYLNGTVWNSGETWVFPFPRLITVVYDVAAVGPVTIGSSSGTANSAAFYLQQASWSPKRLTAAETKHHAALFYRKPSLIVTGPSTTTSAVLTDSALTVVPGDNPVTLPTTWLGSQSA